MKVNKTRRASVAGLAAVALLGTTACSSFINDQATTAEYAASDGIVTEVGDLKLRNIALVGAEKESEGRLIGTLSSDADEALNVTITVTGEDQEFQVEPDENFELEKDENETIYANTGTELGELTEAVVEVDGEASDVKIPVLSGTKKEYRDFLPTELSESDLTDHLHSDEEEEDDGHH